MLALFKKSLSVRKFLARLHRGEPPGKHTQDEREKWPHHRAVSV